MKIFTQNRNEELTLSQMIFPEKYEKLFLLSYILLMPFLMGHLFLLTYISHFNLDTYLNVCLNSNSLLAWCIGYEGFAILFFIILFFYSVINIKKK